MDLRIGPGPAAKQNCPVFVIESKTDTILRREQLRKYRGDCDYLVAVTKYSPEVPERQRKADTVFALRWQDFHRHFSQLHPRDPVEKFLIKSFVEYLEELRMAYPEQLRAGDIKKCRRLFEVAVSQRDYEGMEPRNLFAVADQCVQFMAELRRQLLERVPAYEKCATNGPTFYAWRESAAKRGHAIAWGFRTSPYHLARFDCTLIFPTPTDQETYWEFSLWGSSITDRNASELRIPLSRTVDPEGMVRQDFLLGRLEDVSKKWKAPQVIARAQKRSKE